MYNLAMSNSFLSQNLKAKINIEKCKRCYKCVSRCPQNAIVMGEKGYPKVDTSKCNGCRMCQKPCIDFYYERVDLQAFQYSVSGEIKNTVDKFLTKYNLNNSNSTLLVGFSGGYDSCTLLDVLNQLKEKYRFKLCAAHLNHGWREAESDKEEENCRNFCLQNNVEFYSEKLDKSVPKTETDARDARYLFYKKVSEYLKTQNIFTAHNQNDVVETLIYRLAKGTGVKGLCCIEEKKYLNGLNVFRPLLNISRDKIEVYCKENNLSPNNDSSNFDTKYKRNFVRHEVIPMLEKINPNAKCAINSLHENAKETDSIVNEYLIQVKSQIFEDNKIKTNKFLKLSDALKQRIIYELLIDKNIEYDRKKIIEIVEFIETSSRLNSGKTLSITTDLWLFCSKKEIYFVSNNVEKINDIVKITDFQKSYVLGKYKFTITDFPLEEKFVYPKENELMAYVDLSKQTELELRHRKSGDKIQPFGMKNVIKLKDFFINKGVPKHKRDEIVLLCNHEEVLWACSVGLSEKLRSNNIPTHVIKIEEV